MSTHSAVSVKSYVLVFAALTVLTIVTVAVAYVDLGPWNTLVAMAIAATKAALVVLIFMHVRFESRMVQAFAAAGFFWFFVLLGLTLGDYSTREWIRIPPL